MAAWLSHSTGVRDGVLVEEVERDLEGDVERRQLLRTETAHVVGQDTLRQTDEAVAVNGAHVFQAFRWTDRDLGSETCMAGRHGCADRCAVLHRIAEHLSADDNEDSGPFGVSPGRVWNPIQVPASHDRAWYSSTSAISAFSAAACFRSSAASRAWSAARSAPARNTRTASSINPDRLRRWLSTRRSISWSSSFESVIDVLIFILLTYYRHGSGVKLDHGALESVTVGRSPGALSGWRRELRLIFREYLITVGTRLRESGRYREEPSTLTVLLAAAPGRSGYSHLSLAVLRPDGPRMPRRGRATATRHSHSAFRALTFPSDPKERHTR